jgi:hypothetical protein
MSEVKVLEISPGDIAMSIVPDTVTLLVRVGIGGGEVKSIMDLVRLVQAGLGLVPFTRLQWNGRNA